MANISIIINSSTGGGAEKSMLLLADRMQSKGIETTVIAINKSNLKPGGFDFKLFEINRDWKGGLTNTISAWFRFKKIITQIKPDILILNCDLPEFFTSLLSRNFKLIGVEHSQYPFRTRKLLGWFVRQILGYKKIVWVGVSDHLMIWPKNLKSNYVIYNPIKEFDEEKIEFSTDISRLVFIGRLSWEKNPELVIQIAAKCNLPALFIGDGEDKLSLNKIATANSVSVKFVGFKLDPWALIQSTDLLIVPSRYEGDGLVVIEALQRGIPIMISDIPEFKRFNLPKLNYSATVSEFSDSIIRNSSNLTKFIVDPNIVKKVLINRDIESVTKVWIHLISEILIKKS